MGILPEETEKTEETEISRLVASVASCSFYSAISKRWVRVVTVQTNLDLSAAFAPPGAQAHDARLVAEHLNRYANALPFSARRAQDGFRRGG